MRLFNLFGWMLVVVVVSVMLPAYGEDSYESVTIGGKKWMKRNLNVATAGSICYDKSNDNCAKYGRLYVWEAAKKACESLRGGWRLPTRDEWDSLASYVGGRKDYESYGGLHIWWLAGKKLKSKNGWNMYHFLEDDINGNGTDDFGFSALPGGLLRPDGKFASVGENGAWWSDAEKDAGSAYFRYLGYDAASDYDDGLGEHYNVKRFALSVRCVKD